MKINLAEYLTSEDTDQLAYLPCLIRVFTEVVAFEKPIKYWSKHGVLESDCTNVQSDLSTHVCSAHKTFFLVDLRLCTLMCSLNCMNKFRCTYRVYQVYVIKATLLLRV